MIASEFYSLVGNVYVVTLHLLVRCLVVVVHGRLVCLLVAAAPAPNGKIRTLATIRQSLVLFIEHSRCALARAVVRLKRSLPRTVVTHKPG